MLSDRWLSCLYCLSYLSVCRFCNVGVLWPNSSMDKDETWHAGRPRPWPRCVRWGPAHSPRKGHSPQFSVHTYCGEMAGWIKVPLGMDVGGPGPTSIPSGTLIHPAISPQYISRDLEWSPSRNRI